MQVMITRISTSNKSLSEINEIPLQAELLRPLREGHGIHFRYDNGDIITSAVLSMYHDMDKGYTTIHTKNSTYILEEIVEGEEE